MFGLGAPELLIVLAVIMLLFGGAKVPQLARSLGLAKKEFEAATEERIEPHKTVTTVVQPAPTGPATTVTETTVHPPA